MSEDPSLDYSFEPEDSTSDEGMVGWDSLGPIYADDPNRTE
jgi:hypothetical protein